MNHALMVAACGPSLRYTALCVLMYHEHSIFKRMFDRFPYREQTDAVVEQMYITVAEIVLFSLFIFLFL